MIEIKNIRKSFDGFVAVDSISIDMHSGQVFGLLGTNGAGKSTILRMISGVTKPDQGEILVDGINSYDNPEAKANVFFISDEPFFFGNGEDMAKYYAAVYETFSMDRFSRLMSTFGLDAKRSVSTFSKGMKKQLAIILGLSAQTKYLLCDETFDGLDPTMRQAVKSILASEITEREFTPIIASHNLRELEDICDCIGLIHKGKVLLSQELDELKCNIHKCQCVFVNDDVRSKAIDELKPMQVEKRGSLVTMTLRLPVEEINELMRGYETVYFEVLPLSLEEIFIEETEVVGYDAKKYLLEA